MQSLSTRHDNEILLLSRHRQNLCVWQLFQEQVQDLSVPGCEVHIEIEAIRRG
jgi:hypothetical protein